MKNARCVAETVDSMAIRQHGFTAWIVVLPCNCFTDYRGIEGGRRLLSAATVDDVFADFIRAVSDDHECNDSHDRGGYQRQQHPSEGAAPTASCHSCREEYAEPEG